MDRAQLAYLCAALLASLIAGAVLRIRYLSHAQTYRRLLRRDEAARRRRS